MKIFSESNVGKNKNGCFDCDNCPKNSDPEFGRFCVAWIEYSQDNVVTGETRIKKDCLFRELPVFLVEMIKASNRPAAAVESTRNEIANGFSQVGEVIGKAVHAIAINTEKLEQSQKKLLALVDDGVETR